MGTHNLLQIARRVLEMLVAPDVGRIAALSLPRVAHGGGYAADRERAVPGQPCPISHTGTRYCLRRSGAPVLSASDGSLRGNHGARNRPSESASPWHPSIPKNPRITVQTLASPVVQVQNGSRTRSWVVLPWGGGMSRFFGCGRRALEVGPRIHCGMDVIG